MSFGQRLRREINASGMRIGVVSRIAGLTDVSHLSHMLADRKAPSLETLRRLLKALPDADARWLVCGGKK